MLHLSSIVIMPLLSMYAGCYAVAFLIAGFTISMSDGTVTCYPGNDTVSVTECTVLYNDTLVLNASMLNRGYWYSNVSNSLVCQSSTCTLENLYYKMSGIYTYHSENGHGIFMINITILSPPYFSSCLEPSFKCGNINKTCNQLLVDFPKTNYYHPRINVTVEGYDAASYTVQWILNCSKRIQKGTDSSSSWSYGKRQLSSNIIQFFLEFPLLLRDDMAGDYMAIISNPYGSNTTHTEVLIDRCYPQQRKPHAIKPSQGSSYQRVTEGEPTDAIFEVLVTPNADLFICINQSHNSKLNNNPQCSKCPYNVDGYCTALKDRSTWNVSIQLLNCLDHRSVTVHIPHVQWKDNVTIYLYSWVNSDDYSDGDIAHITLLVKSKIIMIVTVTVTTAVVLIMVVILAIFLGILCTRARRKVRSRQLQAVLEEEGNENRTDLVPNMSGYQSEDSKLVERSRRQYSPSTGYGSFTDSTRSIDERENDETVTIHPPSCDHFSLSGNLDSNYHQV